MGPSTKPKLFVNLEGPILVPGDHPDPLLRAELAPYARPFMHWALNHFDVRLITDRGMHVAGRALQLMGLPEDHVPVAMFDDSKVPLLSKHSNFFWVDGELIPGEVSWLAQHGHVDRLIQVDPVKGVSTDAKQQLEAHIRRTGKYNVK